MAYFGATAAFGAEAAALESQYGLGPVPGSVKDQIVVPVVLQIELKEDCEIWADEDFIFSPTGASIEYSPELLRAAAEQVWTTFRSGALVRDGGVPSSWISKFEFPLPWIARNDRSWESSDGRKLTDDVRLMVWSHFQNFRKLTPDECWAGFRKMAGRGADLVGFSRSMPFSKPGVDEFFRLDPFASIDRAYRHMSQLHGYFSHMAEEAQVGGLIR